MILPFCSVIWNLSFSLPDNMIQKYCNIQVKSLEGFLQSPGYPDYYPKTENCTWKVPMRIGQEVALTLLDVDLKGLRVFTCFLLHLSGWSWYEQLLLSKLLVPGVFSGAQTCRDSLKIMNSSQVLHSICGGVISSTTINISAVDVHVTLYSGGFQPKRGVFISYKGLNYCEPIANYTDQVFTHLNLETCIFYFSVPLWISKNSW